MKKGRLSDIEKKYIEEVDKPVEELAEDLGRNKATVQKHFDKVKKKLSRFVATSDKTPGSYVLTPGGSELGDEVSRKNRQASRKVQDSIHKPLGEDHVSR